MLSENKRHTSLLYHWSVRLAFQPCIIFQLLCALIDVSVLCPSYWFCCVDVSVSRQMLVTGDNVGQLILLSLDGQKVRTCPPISGVDHFQLF